MTDENKTTGPRTLSIIEHVASGDSWLKQASWPHNPPAEAQRKTALATAHFAAAAAKATIDQKAPGELARVQDEVQRELDRRADAARARREEADRGRFDSGNGLFRAPAEAFRPGKLV